MKGITLCADCAYYNMKKHKCTRGCKIDPDISKGENPSFYVDCPLPDVEPSQKWIPCSERLPDNGVAVLVYTGENNFKVWLAEYSKYMEVWTLAGNYVPIKKNAVSHWMPLPEPPEKEEYHEQSADNRA